MHLYLKMHSTPKVYIECGYWKIGWKYAARAMQDSLRLVTFNYIVYMLTGLARTHIIMHRQRKSAKQCTLHICLRVLKKITVYVIFSQTQCLHQFSLSRIHIENSYSKYFSIEIAFLSPVGFSDGNSWHSYCGYYIYITLR